MYEQIKIMPFNFSAMYGLNIEIIFPCWIYKQTNNVYIDQSRRHSIFYEKMYKKRRIL